MTLDLKLTEAEAEAQIGDYEKIEIKAAPNEYNVDRQLEKQIPSTKVLRMYLEIAEALALAVENGFDHGRGNIELVLKYSDSAILATVEDSGPGFNVEERVELFFNGQTYYKHLGRGFRIMHECPAMVGFNPKGNKTLILYQTHENK